MNIKYDDGEGIIAPFGNIKKIPPIAIACYTKEVTDYLLENYKGQLLGTVSKTNIYKISYNGKEVTTFTSPIGAPWAVMVLEDLISIGLKKIVYFGSCGVLDDINCYDILIPTRSYREEGTSFHYIKSKKYINVNTEYKKEFLQLLKDEGIQYRLCKVWTTDAPYRETKNKVKFFTSKGIQCVDMESSALATIGIYRKIGVFIFFYSADSLKNYVWDKRCLETKNNKKFYIAILALKLAYIIENKYENK